MDRKDALIPGVFYRAIRRLPPVEDQFLPQGQRNIVPRRPLSPKELASWNEEISTFDSLGAGDRNARAMNLGEYQAEIALPADSLITAEPDPYRAHHFNLRGDAYAILNAVQRVWHPGTNRIVWEKPS